MSDLELQLRQQRLYHVYGTRHSPRKSGYILEYILAILCFTNLGFTSTKSNLKPKKSKESSVTIRTRDDVNDVAPPVQPSPNITQDVLLQALHKVYPLAAVFTVAPGFQPVTQSL